MKLDYTPSLGVQKKIRQANKLHSEGVSIQEIARIFNKSPRYIRMLRAWYRDQKGQNAKS